MISRDDQKSMGFCLDEESFLVVWTTSKGASSMRDFNKVGACDLM